MSINKQKAQHWGGAVLESLLDEKKRQNKAKGEREPEIQECSVSIKRNKAEETEEHSWTSKWLCSISELQRLTGTEVMKPSNIALLFTILWNQTRCCFENTFNLRTTQWVWFQPCPSRVTDSSKYVNLYLEVWVQDCFWGEKQLCMKLWEAMRMNITLKVPSSLILLCISFLVGGEVILLPNYATMWYPWEDTFFPSREDMVLFFISKTNCEI